MSTFQSDAPQLEVEARPARWPRRSTLGRRASFSVRPEARGSARALAEALKTAAWRAGPAAAAPLFPREAPSPGADPTPQAPADSQGVHWRAGSPFATASLSAALAVAVFWGANVQGWKSSSPEQPLKDGARDGGTVGLGDAVLTAQQAAPHIPSAWSAIGMDLPSRPFPGQARPDANGRCPFEPLVPINNGCWVPVGEEAKTCPPQTFAYKGRCYAPFLRLPSPPTSSPSDAPDGG